MTTTITVTPAAPNFDDVLHVDMPPAPAGAVLNVRLTDPRGGTYTSTTALPLPDTDTDPVTAMRWLWAMNPTSEPDPADPPNALAPTTVRMAVTCDERQLAETTVMRVRMPAGIVREEVRGPGLVGTLFHPVRGRWPGVVLLGGAEGGMHEDDAALLARHGFAVLALAYYGLPGLPAVMTDVSVETFAHGARWVLAHPHVTGKQVGVMGGSKGGEAALLAAATYPKFGAAVSIVGSGVVTSGISQSVLGGNFLDILGTPASCFTHRGQPLPFLPNVIPAELRAAVAAGDPVAMRLAFDPALELSDALGAATIPVERIQGPVLLVSSTDDAGYGPRFHDIAADRRHRAGQPITHLLHEDAGHAIAAPPWAPTTRHTTPGPGVTLTSRGSDQADARARWETWQSAINFLRDALTDTANLDRR